MAYPAAGEPDAFDLILAAEDEALDLGADDLFGLWELLWSLQTRFPAVPATALREVAALALRRLFGQGRVTLVWWDPANDRATHVDPAEVATVLADDANWRPPEDADAPHLRFITTAVGRTALSSGR
ncbi:MAG: hypothetical protein QJR03_05560 [Sphaerobacter sp.]|nr:hypothetical protein [Sphaerobacter sp.]